MKITEIITEAAEKQLTQVSDQDLQKLLGKGKLNALVRHPWFQEYRNYTHAYKHGVSSSGFTIVEVYSYFPNMNVTAEGRIRPLIMVSFTFSYSGRKVIQAYKYHRAKEPDENEKRMGPQAGWRHFKTWAKEEDAVKDAWDRHNAGVTEGETYQPPELEVGDKILKGKFKNSPATIKGFAKDKHNQPVLKTDKGAVQLFKPRVTKLMTNEAVQNPFTSSKIKVPVYHGTNVKFTKFVRPPHGVFFTPHADWASDHYGSNVLACYVNVKKLYQLAYGKDFDEAVMDALFDRDYNTLAAYIQKLKAKGYDAMQAPGDSEMICVFDTAQIVNADTGEGM